MEDLVIAPLTPEQYDGIAAVLHQELTHYDPFSGSQTEVARWNTVRGCAAALTAEFSDDPAFDADRFIRIAMTGAPSRADI